MFQHVNSTCYFWLDMISRNMPVLVPAKKGQSYSPRLLSTPIQLRLAEFTLHLYTIFWRFNGEFQHLSSFISWNSLWLLNTFHVRGRLFRQENATLMVMGVTSLVYFNITEWLGSTHWPACCMVALADSRENYFPEENTPPIESVPFQNLWWNTDMQEYVFLPENPTDPWFCYWPLWI